MATVEDGHFDDLMYRHYFAQQLSGVQVDYSKDGGQFKIFQRVDEEARDAAIRSGRLASPDHYRLYFALAEPSHALTQHDFDAVWSAAKAGVTEVEALLLKWHGQSRVDSLSKTDVLFERLRGGAGEAMTPIQRANILRAISNAMDKAYRVRAFDYSWISSLWDRAENLLPVLLSPLSGGERQAVLHAIFKEGDSISWLTTLFRSETFAHGRFGSRREPEESWLLTEPELDQITQIMISRSRRHRPHDPPRQHQQAERPPETAR